MLFLNLPLDKSHFITGRNAFAWCYSLTSVVIPKSVTSIEAGAFGCCYGLASVEVLGRVESIGEDAFDACYNLTSVEIMGNVANIREGAFRGCDKLQEMCIVVSSGEKLRFPEVGTGAFDGTPDEKYIFFVDETGQELTGDALDNAKAAFLEAEKADGFDDGKWYGWSVKGVSVVKAPGTVGGTNSGSNSGGGSSSADNANPGGGSNSGADLYNANPDSGKGTGDTQMTIVSEMLSAPTGNDATDHTDAIPVSGGQESSAGGASADTSAQTANGTEPKTGDASHMEVYATLAMIAGLTYLLLYFMEEGRGMTEREKDVFVAALIRWGKKGGAFRRGCAMMAIFCLLAYYHSVGKRAGKNILDENGLRTAL